MLSDVLSSMVSQMLITSLRQPFTPPGNLPNTSSCKSISMNTTLTSAPAKKMLITFHSGSENPDLLVSSRAALKKILRMNEQDEQPTTSLDKTSLF